MKDKIIELFVNNWPRKLIALVASIVIWFLVDETITITRTIPNIPVRVINLPGDKTVIGLMPNGVLKKRTAVTVTGKKGFIDDLSQNDLEVVINAENKKESYLATITRKNLFYLYGDQEIRRNISEVSANDVFVKISNLTTADVKVKVITIGDPPAGYQTLDVWPKVLIQKISGPKEQVELLKDQGLFLKINLSKISKDDLEALKDVQGSGEGEVSFLIPSSWKQVAIPFRDNALEPLNDPRAEYLRVELLKQDFLAVGASIPIGLYFSPSKKQKYNPSNTSIGTTHLVSEHKGIYTLNIPLYAKEVSRLFLEAVKDEVMIMINVDPDKENHLPWSIQFVDPNALEKRFVDLSLQEEAFKGIKTKYSNDHLCQRFREFMLHFTLYAEEADKPIDLSVRLENGKVLIDSFKN